MILMPCGRLGEWGIESAALRAATAFFISLDSPCRAGRSFPLQEKNQKCPQGGYAALENPLITGVIRYATTWQTGFPAECSGPSEGEALADLF